MDIRLNRAHYVCGLPCVIGVPSGMLFPAAMTYANTERPLCPKKHTAVKRCEDYNLLRTLLMGLSTTVFKKAVDSSWIFMFIPKPTSCFRKNHLRAFQGGFTLIEALVVIGIIAILAAILFPVMAKAKETAKASAAASNVRQLAQAMLLYADSYDDRFCLAAYTESEAFILWHDLLDPYVRNKEIWLCPGSSVSTTDLTGGKTAHWGYNAGYLTTIFPDFSNFIGHTATSYSDIRQPVETVLFTSAKSSVPNSWCGDDGKFLLPPSWSDSDCWGRPDPVHFQQVTIAWIDTHVNRKPLSSFYSGQDPVDNYFDRE